VAALRPGLLEYTDPTGARKYVSVSGGFAEILPNKVTVLADEAQMAHEIDLARAEADLEAARKALRGESTELTSEQAVVELDRAMQRVKAARSAR
jgi:F-type H+-transporting ATPase subunit epsilon